MATSWHRALLLDRPARGPLATAFRLAELAAEGGGHSLGDRDVVGFGRDLKLTQELLGHPSGLLRGDRGSSRHFRLGPFTISVHSATRCYYQIRNCFLLFRRPHIPFVFALKQLAATLFGRTVLLFVVRDRMSYLKSYLFAVRDGLKGVTGARPV